ncbi:MAG: hypothetical protein DRN14_05260 [Thermoplasmata archaeon]|nr:MAG: hypothetical protein DRN14_05260 [Thermoplasmata archaeon]
MYDCGFELAKTIIRWAEREDRSELDWYVPAGKQLGPQPENFLRGLFDGLQEMAPKDWDWGWEWLEGQEGVVVIRKKGGAR